MGGEAVNIVLTTDQDFKEPELAEQSGLCLKGARNGLENRIGIWPQDPGWGLLGHTMPLLAVDKS